eukprot:TRINITY_DN11967_c0_g2_i12.p1 TRINITY_DN11967_c0_g2~~TRINITY_DN11967_c0_g2_i12.p1  ORF type:complete len:586 (+),score=150.32 TRINITY_DN11967_c0_g2_i12:327-2084(+)
MFNTASSNSSVGNRVSLLVLQHALAQRINKPISQIAAGSLNAQLHVMAALKVITDEAKLQLLQDANIQRQWQQQQAVIKTLPQQQQQQHQSHQQNQASQQHHQFPNFQLEQSDHSQQLKLSEPLSTIIGTTLTLATARDTASLTPGEVMRTNIGVVPEAVAKRDVLQPLPKSLLATQETSKQVVPPQLAHGNLFNAQFQQPAMTATTTAGLAPTTGGMNADLCHVDTDVPDVAWQQGFEAAMIDMDDPFGPSTDDQELVSLLSVGTSSSSDLPYPSRPALHRTSHQQQGQQQARTFPPDYSIGDLTQCNSASQSLPSWQFGDGPPRPSAPLCTANPPRRHAADLGFRSGFPSFDFGINPNAFPFAPPFPHAHGSSLPAIQLNDMLQSASSAFTSRMDSLLTASSDSVLAPLTGTVDQDAPQRHQQLQFQQQRASYSQQQQQQRQSAFSDFTVSSSYTPASTVMASSSPHLTATSPEPSRQAHTYTPSSRSSSRAMNFATRRYSDLPENARRRVNNMSPNRLARVRAQARTAAQRRKEKIQQREQLLAERTAKTQKRREELLEQMSELEDQRRTLMAKAQAWYSKQ